jgi:hypothetical protein
LINGVMILALYLIGNPAIYRHLGDHAVAFSGIMTTLHFNELAPPALPDSHHLSLTTALNYDSKLWKVYSVRPSDWPLIQETEAAFLSDDFRIIQLRPSKSLIFHGAPFHTNRWGMRDKDYEMWPATGTYRVVMVGSSYVMGSGVADHETFEAILEEHWNRNTATSGVTKYEILNQAVAGHSALSELWQLEDTGLSFHPDAIFFIAHDREEEKVVSHLADRARLGLDIPYSYLVETAREAGLELGMSQLEAERRLKPYGSALVAWTYRRVVMLAEHHGIHPIWIYMVPPDDGMSEENASELMELAVTAGFTVIDLSHLYDGYDLISLSVAEWDRHPNALGHRLLADRLHTSLLLDNVLPSLPSD